MNVQEIRLDLLKLSPTFNADLLAYTLTYFHDPTNDFSSLALTDFLLPILLDTLNREMLIPLCSDAPSRARFSHESDLAQKFIQGVSREEEASDGLVALDTPFGVTATKGTLFILLYNRRYHNKKRTECG
jgi:hypothetical protein